VKPAFPQPTVAYWIVPAACVLALLLIWLTGSETAVFLFLNHLGNFAGNTFWISLTTLGDGFVAFALILPFVYRKPREAWALVLSWIVVAISVKATKHLIVSYRPLFFLSPDSFRLISAPFRYYSFPSGHAMTVAAFGGTLCLFYRNKLVWAVILLIALSICFSRIAMGIHWPTDVLVGIIGGWVIAWLTYLLSQVVSFGSRPIFQVLLGVLMLGAAITLFFYNHTNYPEAQPMLRAISLASIGLALGGMYLAYRRKKRLGLREAQQAEGG